MTPRTALLAAACLAAYATPVAIWPFETIAKAPVLVTAVVESVKLDPLPADPNSRNVPAHATLRVLRCFPLSALTPGSRIQLDYPTGRDSAFNQDGRAVQRFRAGQIFALPLKSNLKPGAPWNLIGDDGVGLVVPAIAADPAFAAQPPDGRDFLMREIVSAMVAGSRQELMASAGYANSQRNIAPELTKFLEMKLADRDPRWSLIAAAILSGMGVPRPTVEELRDRSEMLLSAVLRKLGPSQAAKERLIRDLLAKTDIASWGVGVTLRQYAQEPVLVDGLRRMLKARSPYALEIARNILGAGQKELLADSLAVSLEDLAAPKTSDPELRSACWVLRDFGSDEQYGRLVEAIRASQFRDQERYDRLWRNVIWSDNPRERVVLDILSKDTRMSPAKMPYSEIARGELKRISR